MHFQYSTDDFYRSPGGVLLPTKMGLRGRIHGIRIFSTPDDFEKFNRGELVPCLTLPDSPNGITDVGIHYLLDAGFRGTSQLSNWYAGLIDNASFTGVAAADTMASHSGWVENQDYDETVRQTLAFAAASSRSISHQVSFTMNATGTVTLRGVFVNSDNTKGGTTGTLWATALFSTQPSLVSGNVLTVNYSLTD